VCVCVCVCVRESHPLKCAINRIKVYKECLLKHFLSEKQLLNIITNFQPTVY